MSWTKKDLIRSVLEREDCYVRESVIEEIFSIATGTETQVSYMDRLQKVESELEDLKRELKTLSRRLG